MPAFDAIMADAYVIAYIYVDLAPYKEAGVTTTTIRVSTKTRDTLRELAQTVGLSMQQVVEQAIENYRRQHFLNAANTAYAKLRADQQAWQEEEAERTQWDATLADGLEDW